MNGTDVFDTAVVGAGISALSFLASGGGFGSTVVLEYQDHLGGPLEMVLPSEEFPEETHLLARCLNPQPSMILTGTTALGLLPGLHPNDPHTLLIRNRGGTENVRARQVVIASGGIEDTRESAQVPGPRPAGIMTPILANALLQRGLIPGRAAVVYGNSRYAMGTAHRLHRSGVAMTVVLPIGSADRPRCEFPVTGPANLVRVAGSARLTSVTVTPLVLGGECVVLPADTLVYAAGMKTNALWLKGSGVEMTPEHTIRVHNNFETSIPRVYAIGTAIHPSLNHVGSIGSGRELANHLRGPR